MLTCQDVSDQVSSSVAKLITDRWKFFPQQKFNFYFSNDLTNNLFIDILIIAYSQMFNLLQDSNQMSDESGNML